MPKNPASTSPAKEANNRQAVSIAQAEWSGPLPPPAALERFDQIIPNGADRIMLMVEHEQAHRISHENRELEATISATLIGQVLGAAISATAIFAAAYTAYIGAHPAVSIALVGLPIAAIVRSFNSRRSK